MKEPNQIVEILLRQQLESERRGLGRLIVHFQLQAEVDALAARLGCLPDSDEAYFVNALWRLVGPKLAEDHRIYKGTQRGAPEKAFKSIDIQREREVEKAHSICAAKGLTATDSQIIEFFQEIKHPLFLPSGEGDRVLRNSVSRGRTKLQKI